MSIASNFSAIPVFAESNNENNQETDSIFFAKDGKQTDNIQLQYDKEVAIELINNSDENEIDISIPKNVEYIEKEGNINGLSSKYNENNMELNVKFPPSTQDKKFTFILKAIASDIPDDILFAKTSRNSYKQLNSKKVQVQFSKIIHSTNSEDNKFNDSPLSSNSVSEASTDDIQNIKEETDEMPPPPPSNVNILDYFNIPNLGTANNSASPIVEYPQSVMINPNSNEKFGVMWANTTIDLNHDFELDSYVYMYNKDNPARHADGLNFVIQNDNNINKAYGRQGWGIGTYGTANDPRVSNALAFEMDTYYNGDGSELNIDVLGNGMTQNLQGINYNGHIAVLETNRDISEDYASSYGVPKEHGGDFGQMKHNNIQYGTDDNPVFGNRWKRFNVKWNRTTKTFSFSLDGFDVTNYKVDDIQKVFGSDTVRFGFTGSTGSSTEYNGVSFNKLPVAPVKVFYKDVDTNEEISESETITGNLGEKWSSSKKEIENYKYVKTDGEPSGIFLQTPQEVTYWYKKLKPKVALTKAVDKAKAKVGDTLTYTITAENSGTADWKGIIRDAIPTEYVDYL